MVSGRVRTTATLDLKDVCIFTTLFNQGSPNLSVEHDRVITRDQDLTGTEVGSVGTLGDDNASVLSFDNEISQASQPAVKLSKDWDAHGVIIAEIHHGVLIIDRGKSQDNTQVIGDPILPQISIAEL